MLTAHPATQASKRAGRPKIGLAIAGGGPLGAIYELGALRALDESLKGIRLDRLDVYVGVSAGAFLAASLANRISTAEMCRIFMSTPDAEFAFRPERFLRPAYREYMTRARKMPRILLRSLTQYIKNPFQSTLSESLGTLSQAVPTGLFNNETIDTFLRAAFAVAGRSNDFRELNTQLYVLSVDLDNGAAVRFGEPGNDHVPISLAVQASAALPGLYPPVVINDRYYVDGALRRTLHGSAALNDGVDLLFGINPLVPYDSEQVSDTEASTQNLVHGGLPVILSQTFRALIQSRIKVGFEKYRKQYPGASLLLVEPDRDDQEIFFTNIFSYSSRSRLCEHAYQTTRAQLRERADELDSLLAPYGGELDRQVLQDETRTLKHSMDADKRRYSPVASQLSGVLDDLDDWLDKRSAG